MDQRGAVPEVDQNNADAVEGMEVDRPHQEHFQEAETERIVNKEERVEFFRSVADDKDIGDVDQQEK